MTDLATLSAATLHRLATLPNVTALTVEWGERAGIREHDGGQPREKAQMEATEDLWKHYPRLLRGDQSTHSGLRLGAIGRREGVPATRPALHRPLPAERHAPGSLCRPIPEPRPAHPDASTGLLCVPYHSFRPSGPSRPEDSGPADSGKEE